MVETMGRAKWHYQVAERAGHVEVTGASGADVDEALGLLARWREEQAKLSAGVTTSIVDALVAMGTGLSPQRVLAAQRLAEHRAALLETPVFTHETLAAARAQKGDAVRAWVTRHRAAGDLVVVKAGGRTIVPSFQFTDDGQLREDVARVNRILSRGGEATGWEMWTWWHARTGLLSDQTPIDALDDTPGRVETAARRHATPDAF